MPTLVINDVQGAQSMTAVSLFRDSLLSSINEPHLSFESGLFFEIREYFFSFVEVYCPPSVPRLLFSCVFLPFASQFLF